MLNFKILILFTILFGTNGFTQKDTLNNFNSNGKKDGVWKVYLDDSVNPIDSSESYFYGFELWDNGKRVFKYYKHPRKLSVEYSGFLPKKGKPIELEGIFKYYNKKGILWSEEIYKDGKPIYIRSYFNNDNDSLESKGGEFLFFNKLLNGQTGTYYYEERNNKGVVYLKGWFKKGDKGWRFYKD